MFISKKLLVLAALSFAAVSPLTQTASARTPDIENTGSEPFVKRTPDIENTSSEPFAKRTPDIENEGSD